MLRIRQRKFNTTDQTEVDLTPLLDVVFIILIFFIVTASFIKEKGLALYVPDSGAAKPLELPLIVLEINANNEIFIQDRLVDARRIKPTILRLSTELKDSIVVLRVAPSAKTKVMVEAIDGIRQANVVLPAISLTST